MSRRPLVWIVLVVSIVAVTVRVAHWASIAGTPLDRWHRWNQTDMATFLEQGRRFAAGDWLGREAYHPYHAWQHIAPPAQWEQWYGPGFHQAPGYSYLLAALRGTAEPRSDAGLVSIKAGQVLLGALTCVLMALLARELVGDRGGEVAATVAGLVAALYGPLYYLEVQLLREGPAICLMTAILLLAVRYAGAATDAARRELARNGALLGVLLGVFWVLHELGLVLGVAVIASLATISAARSGKRAAVVALALGAGLTLGFTPVVVRNLAVRAPLLSVSCRMPINFAVTNIADTPDGGAVFTTLSPGVGPLLERAADETGRATMAGVVREAWRSYDGSWTRMASNWWKRFRVQWAGVEIPDNTSFHFYRERSRVLRASLGFGAVMGPGAAAMLALACAGVTQRRSSSAGDDGPLREIWRRRGRGHLVVLTTMAMVLGSLTFVHSVGRFRLYLAAFFVIYTGVFAGVTVTALRARRMRLAVALAGTAALLSIVPARTVPPGVVPAARPSDYVAAARIAIEDEDWEQAVEFLEKRTTHPDRRAEILVDLGRVYGRLERWSDAEDAFRRALRERPGFAPARRGLEEAQRRASST